MYLDAVFEMLFRYAAFNFCLHLHFLLTYDSSVRESLEFGVRHPPAILDEALPSYALINCAHSTCLVNLPRAIVAVGDSIICSTRRTFHLRSPPLRCRGSNTNHGIQSTRAPLPRLPGGRRNSGVSHCVSTDATATDGPQRPSPPPPSPGNLGRQSVLLGWKDEREGREEPIFPS